MRSLPPSNHKKQVKVVRIIKTPIRAISKALDLYVKGVNNFSTAYNTPLRTATTEAASLEDSGQQLPRSFTTSRLSLSYEQPPEGPLVRSISTASTQINIANLEAYMIQHHRHQLTAPSAARKGVPRSCSVGMGRIDEDRVSSFRNDSVLFKSKLPIKENDSVYGRSRTYGHVSNKRRMLM